MFPIALEESIKTIRWPTRVFQFTLAVTEVNVRRALQRVYAHPPSSQQEFRRQLAYGLIYNPFVVDETQGTSPRRARTVVREHKLLSLPPYKFFDKAGRFKKCQSQYLQKQCSACSKRCRTYCKCTPGIMYCQDCYNDHKDNE